MEKKILFLGPEGTYCEMAKDIAVKLLSLKDYEPVAMPNISAILSAVDKDEDLIAIIPIENSIEGLVQETVDKIVRTKNYIRIFQEIIVPISHTLISKSGDVSKVRKIVSHPQGLAQCCDYVYNLGKKINQNIETIPFGSTSGAVELLKDFDESYAAIASKKSADIFGMKVLEENINDEKGNKTRFACIGHKYPNSTGNDKTSIAFATNNKPGALVDVLNIFKENSLNMSSINSRPSKKFLGEYMFYVDLDGHVEDENLKTAIEKIRPLITFYRLIGSYPKFN